MKPNSWIAEAKRALGAGLILSMLTTSCSWVKLEPGAENVQVSKSAAVEDCKLVGSTRARTKSRLGIFARSSEKVSEELQTIARNDAPALGGDTIVADGPITAEGIQRFSVYDCSESASPPSP